MRNQMITYVCWGLIFLMCIAAIAFALR
jgi:hypothetical protein